ncbi:MAG: DUF3850 domain-containing protein [Candidatus Gribaldobacteria bacterium]|nr:DUF3850 domain-containing protein [Candidatus Gribaldobacteria bacterium]
MKIIKKKTWPEYFELVLAGKKKFDLRLADFDIEEGDILVLEEWDPQTKEYTGRKIEKKVDYVLKLRLDDFGQKEKIEKDGLLVIQLGQSYEKK